MIKISIRTIKKINKIAFILMFAYSNKVYAGDFVYKINGNSTFFIIKTDTVKNGWHYTKNYIYDATKDSLCYDGMERLYRISGDSMLLFNKILEPDYLYLLREQNRLVHVEFEMGEEYPNFVYESVYMGKKKLRLFNKRNLYIFRINSLECMDCRNYIVSYDECYFLYKKETVEGDFVMKRVKKYPKKLKKHLNSLER